MTYGMLIKITKLLIVRYVFIFLLTFYLSMLLSYVGEKISAFKFFCHQFKAQYKFYFLNVLFTCKGQFCERKLPATKIMNTDNANAECPCLNAVSLHQRVVV